MVVVEHLGVTMQVVVLMVVVVEQVDSCLMFLEITLVVVSRLNQHSMQ